MQTSPQAAAVTAQAIPPRAYLLAEHHRATLSHYSREQQDAAVRLYKLAKYHTDTGGGSRAAKFLLSLYNGRRFQFDLTDFRCFDSLNFDAALTVLQMDAKRTWCEIHVILDAILGEGANTGAEFEHWAYDLKLRGRCSKENLPPMLRLGVPA